MKAILKIMKQIKTKFSFDFQLIFLLILCAQPIYYSFHNTSKVLFSSSFPSSKKCISLKELGQSRFYFVTMIFPSESRRGVIAAPYPDFQQR